MTGQTKSNTHRFFLRMRSRSLVLGATSLTLLFGLMFLVGCAARMSVEKPQDRTFEEKMSWILRLEDQRILQTTQAPPAAEIIETNHDANPIVQGRSLLKFLTDTDARIRRRAALAVGRVGLAEGVTPLVSTLADPDPEVRQVAAFALGLIRDLSGVEALKAALIDPSPLVKGRAAQALGLIGDRTAAAAVSDMVFRQLSWGVEQPDDFSFDVDPNVDSLRLGISALARLGRFEPMAEALLDAGGQPRIPWWPLAHALQQLNDQRSLSALISFVRWPSSYGATFAAKALGELGDVAAVDDLLHLIQSDDPFVAASAVSALGRLGESRVVSPLLRLLRHSDLPLPVQRETIAALGNLRASEATNVMLDLLSHKHPLMRAEALQALAKISPETFSLVLSGLDPDRDWTVRAALARVLGSLDLEFSTSKLKTMLRDSDQRVVASVLSALVRLRPDGINTTLLDHLHSDDPNVRATSARGIGELGLEEAVESLIEAYHRSNDAPHSVTRLAVIESLSNYQTSSAKSAIEMAMADSDWSVRERAAEILSKRDPSRSYMEMIRPAPVTMPSVTYDEDELVNPTVSPHVYLETSKGTVQIELAVLDAPLTVRNFTRLASEGFFDGVRVHFGPGFALQTGEPGCGSCDGLVRAIRDEVNEIPFVRGTVVMVNEGPNTGAGQFLIMRMPQPHFEAIGTAFGRVVAGWSVLDSLEEGDRLLSARVWDGTDRFSQ